MACEGVGRVEVGVGFDPTLVEQVVGGGSRLLEVEACLPKVDCSAFRGRGEPDASNDWVGVGGSVSPGPSLDWFS